MVKLTSGKKYLYKGKFVDSDFLVAQGVTEKMIDEAYKGTISYNILKNHNTGGETCKGAGLQIKFDAMASHDITYVGIIQTAKASGLEKFPIPYVLTNCHNSLCAVGGTINEDDHVFGLSAAKKYGGIFVPPHQAVIHTFMRENMTGCGKMILGSDSHTRYGALGTIAVGEGGPELVKQLLCRTYDITYPDVIAINLIGKPRKGVGPQDVALAIIGSVFKQGFVKNKIMEFVGSGINNLPIEYRNGIDVMTTETTCLSSIWKTDDIVKEYYYEHGRPNDFAKLEPAELAMYDGVVEVDLSKVEPKIALPFHPSNVYNLADVIANPKDIFAKVEEDGNKLLSANKVKFNLLDKITKDGKVQVQQGIIAGCAGGTYDNIVEASNIIDGKYIGKNEFTMSVYPSSQPIYYDLMNKGAISKLVKAGVNIKTAFCGPCFGAGDVPANNALSIRHTTRNFESREGSKPANGQISSVALMDARSIAATAMNGGILTSALDLDYDNTIPKFCYDASIYQNRCYNGVANPNNQDLVYGPNIKDWPEVIHLTDNILLKMTAVINDPVTTTDELIPSGETSSYRSNPLKLAEFALSRKVPEYVPRAKEVYADELARRKENKLPLEYEKALKTAKIKVDGSVSIASIIYATKPGDGSAREQAASCQRVLGGAGNIAREYATKRYRSNLINWGMIPFISDNDNFEVNDIIYIKDVKKGIEIGAKEFKAIVINGDKVRETILKVDSLTDTEKDIIVSGCLMNYYKDRK